jgi:hypothetical protein
MPVVFTDGIYPYVTLMKDACGYIHMWEGQVIPSNHPALPTVGGREAKTFIQREDDIETLTDYLTEEERDFLSTGYHIQTRNIPDDYLIHE